MRRLTLIGSTGQLGTDLVVALQQAGDFEVIPLTHADIECTDPSSVQRALLAVRPEIVVNCAAFVRVDECEHAPAQAFLVNAVGALYVARICAEMNSRCVYVSTDYVFQGTKGAPYTEEDSPNPINVYGASKLAGECLVREAAPHWLIVRTASLFGLPGSRGKGGNFVETVIARARRGDLLTVVDDVRMSPTYTRDLTRGIAQLLRSDSTGVVHLTNAGSATWYEFARKILGLLRLEADIRPIASGEYKTAARRPTNSTLASVVFGNPLRSWEDALEDHLVACGYQGLAESRGRPTSAASTFESHSVAERRRGEAGEGGGEGIEGYHHWR